MCVKVKGMGKIIWKLIVDIGERGFGTKPQKIFFNHALQTVGKCKKHLLSIYAVLILA